MTEYRFARPEEEPQILDLIDLVFSQGSRPHDFRKLLPKVYAHPGFAGFHAVAVQENRIRAVIAMLPLTLHYAGGLLQGGYVGSVAVHSQSRGEGHMKALMQLQLNAARSQSYDFLALGGQRQRYGYFGFENGGTALTFRLNSANMRHALPEADPDAVALRPLLDAADPALLGIAALHEGQPCFCRRDPARLYDILCSYNAVPYAVEDRPSGALRGYFVAQGSDISEMTLTDEALCAPVLKAWGRNHAGFSLRVWDGQTERGAFLRSVAEGYTLADAEMLRVLHWPRVLFAALKFKNSYQPLPEGRKVIAIEGCGALCLLVKAGEAAVFPTGEAPDLTLTEQQAISFFFSPLSAFLQADPLLVAWLPLPLSLLTADQF